MSRNAATAISITNDNLWAARHRPGSGISKRQQWVEAVKNSCGVTAWRVPAMAATVVDLSAFRSSGEFAAFLVPRQNCSGGKDRLGRIFNRMMATCASCWSSAPPR
jgi:hypothetical protein